MYFLYFLYFLLYFTNFATCPWLSLIYPWLSLPYPCLSLLYPCLSLLSPWLSLVSLLSRGILGIIPVGQEDSVAAPCSLSLTMVEAGAKLHIPVIKWGLLLNNMDVMSLQMWPFSAKMTRPQNRWESSSSSTWKWTSDEGWEGDERMSVGHSRKEQC